MTLALVTGATGIVGNSIATMLAREGRPVRALVRSLDKARAMTPAEIELVQGDVTERASVRAALQGVSTVFHAAGLPEQWLADEELFRRVNVDGTRNVAEEAKAAQVRLAYTSTIDVFRAAPGERFDESVIDPEPKGTAYERSKQEADHVVAELVIDGLDAVFLHPAALYGPAPAGSPGLNDFIIRLAKRQAPMLIPGGMPVVHSEDCARGHVLAAQRAAPGSRFILCEAYYDIKEIAQMAARELGLARTPPMMPLFLAKGVAAIGEALSAIIGKPPLIPRGQLHFLQWGARPSSDKARRELGWTTRPFHEGVAQTIEWLEQQGRIPRSAS